MLKRESTIFKVINQEKFYEIATAPNLNNLRRILFSYFNVRAIGLIKTYQETKIQESVIRYVEGRRDTSIMERTDLYKESFGEIGKSREEQNFDFQEPLERLLTYPVTAKEQRNGSELIMDSGVKSTTEDSTTQFFTIIVHM